MSGYRLPRSGHVDRDVPLSFRWNGRAYTGFAGDTLASALMASGTSLFGRSFKYHRRRGLMAAGLEEPNAIVQLEAGAQTIPNLKATQIELYDGLVANPVNSWPSLAFDIMAINGLLKRFIPAAFYYKTFMWPRWHLFEGAIRKAAGLGVAPRDPDPDIYEHRHDHVDVLVVGSGAAGLTAALEAAKSGAKTLLVEADAELGGGLLSECDAIEGLSPLAWRHHVVAQLKSAANVTIARRTMAFGIYDHNLVGLCERLSDHVAPAHRQGVRQRMWKVRAGKIVLATGAFERPMTFGRNDIPGVMLASAAKTYALRFGVAPGRRCVVVTNNDSAYEAALALHDAGVHVAAIIDSRLGASRYAADAAARKIRIVHGAAPVRAAGRRRVSSLAFARVADGVSLGSIACDTVLVSGGWNPAIHLYSQAGGTAKFSDALQTFLPATTLARIDIVGAAAGLFHLDSAINSARRSARGYANIVDFHTPVGPTLHLRDASYEAGEAWLDFQNDVTVADVQLAARENFQSVEHLKRYTTLGMATDQGKTSNIPAITHMSKLLARPAQAIGTTRFRPPFDPVTIGAFAGKAVGENLHPMARCAAHGAQLGQGAVMEAYGRWERAAYFANHGVSEADAIAREVRGVRNSVGLFDASPLGKIEVKGPDASVFLQRMYLTSVATLKPGRSRYALMLNDNGVAYDDGIITRMADNHFLVGTTSSHAAAIADMFREWLQCEWPHLKVMIEDITTAWSVLTIAGPKARSVLEAIGSDIDLSREAFPHMSFRAGTVGGVTARVHRVSFSGELSYEVAVPWGFGAALWEAALTAGAQYDILPFGIEALMVMRIEKGFLHIGSDTDGTTLPQDIGFATPLAKRQGDFVGRRSALRPDGMRGDRRQLVGLEICDDGGALDPGAHVLAAAATQPIETQGWVTSSAFSPTLERPIAMALVERGQDRIGETVRIWSLGTWRTARIADQRFFDPAGERLDA